MNCPKCGEPDIEIQPDNDPPLWGCRNCEASGRILVSDDHMGAVGSGVLKVTVWPVMIGAASDHPGNGLVPLNEPRDDSDYQRGHIDWTSRPDGTVTGAARVWLPKGVFRYLLFCSGPHEEALMGSTPLEQPIVFDRPGYIDIDPIQNQDVLPRGA